MAKYKISRKIGAGAFGKVYLLQTGTREQEEFALKIVDMSELKRDEGECGNEGTLMLKLCHAHLVHCYDAFICKPHLYLLMELCCHGSLEQYLDGRGSFVPEKQVLTWMSQLADVLRYLHAIKVIHRDLKPANIFLDGNQNIKLGDLGVARELDHTAQERQTQTGTLPYMSPELFTSLPYNFKTDIWGLGCCIHEVMTLKKTFQGQSWVELHHLITSAEVPEMPMLYQRRLQKLVLSLLDADPSQRPDALEILLILFHIQGKKFSSSASQPVDVPSFDQREICHVVKSYEMSSRSDVILPLRADSDNNSCEGDRKTQTSVEDSRLYHREHILDSEEANGSNYKKTIVSDPFQRQKLTPHPPRPLPVPKTRKKKKILNSLKNKSKADDVQTDNDFVAVDPDGKDTPSPRLSPHPVDDHSPTASQCTDFLSVDSQDSQNSDDWTKEYMETLAQESIQWLRNRFKPKPTDTRSDHSDNNSDNCHDDSDVDDDDDDDVPCGLVTLFTQSQTAVYINNIKPMPNSSTDADKTPVPNDLTMSLDLSESAVRAAQNTIKVFRGEDPSILKLMLIKILGFRGYVLYGQHLLQTMGDNSTLKH